MAKMKGCQRTQKGLRAAFFYISGDQAINEEAASCDLNRYPVYTREQGRDSYPFSPFSV